MMVSLGLCYQGMLHVLYKDIIRLESWTTETLGCMSEGCTDGCTNTTRLRVHIFLHPLYACIPAKRAVLVARAMMGECRT